MRFFSLFSLMISCVLCASDADAQFLKRNRATVVQPAEKEKAELTEGYRTIYDTARARAVGQLARKKNISRAEAREMINDIADNETLHLLATKAGIKVTAMPKGISGFIQWLIDHQEQILALVKLILALFGVDAETAWQNNWS